MKKSNLFQNGMSRKRLGFFEWFQKKAIISKVCQEHPQEIGVERRNPQENPQETTRLTPNPQENPQETKRILRLKDGTKLKDMEVSIIDLMLSEPGVSQKEIAKRFGVSMESVKHYVNKLKDYNVLKREGATKKDMWIVNEEILVKE